MFDIKEYLAPILGVLALLALFLARGKVSTYFAVRKNRKNTKKLVKDLLAKKEKKVKDATRIRTVPRAKSAWSQLLDKARGRSRN